MSAGLTVQGACTAARRSSNATGAALPVLDEFTRKARLVGGGNKAPSVILASTRNTNSDIPRTAPTCLHSITLPKRNRRSQRERTKGYHIQYHSFVCRTRGPRSSHCCWMQSKTQPAQRYPYSTSSRAKHALSSVAAKRLRPHSVPPQRATRS